MTDAPTPAQFLVTRSDVEEDLLDVVDLLANVTAAIETGRACPPLTRLPAVLMQLEQVLTACGNHLPDDDPTAAEHHDQAASLRLLRNRLQAF